VAPILAAREQVGEFTSVAHCLRSLPSRSVNHKVIECLAKAGCLDSFGVPREAIISHLDELMELTAREREQHELGQGFLFDDLMSETLEERLKEAPRAEHAERLAREREVLGFYLSGHPLDGHREQLQLFADCTVAELPERLGSGVERVTIGGLVDGLKVMPIKKEGPNHGRKMAVWELEDATGSVRVVAFPDAFEQAERVLAEGLPVLVVASLKGEGDHVELLADEVTPLEGVARRRAAALRIVLHLDEVTEERLQGLREYLLDHSGDLPVRIELIRAGSYRARLVPPPPLTVDGSRQTRDGLKRFVGSGWSEFEFDVSVRNGVPKPPPAATDGDPEAADLVN
jgi:DNA polymerase-3 subunit alpha